MWFCSYFLLSVFCETSFKSYPLRCWKNFQRYTFFSLSLLNKRMTSASFWFESFFFCSFFFFLIPFKKKKFHLVSKQLSTGLIVPILYPLNASETSLYSDEVQTLLLSSRHESLKWLSINMSKGSEGHTFLLKQSQWK